jgi:hypothetical protein
VTTRRQFPQATELGRSGWHVEIHTVGWRCSYAAASRSPNFRERMKEFRSALGRLRGAPTTHSVERHKPWGDDCVYMSASRLIADAFESFHERMRSGPGDLPVRDAIALGLRYVAGGYRLDVLALHPRAHRGAEQLVTLVLG